MSTDRQKSFVATVGVNGKQLHFLDAFHGEPVYVATRLFSGGFFTGRPQKIDHSHFLALRSNTPVPLKSLLTLYFRHSNHGYTLYIRTPGQHYGKCLSYDGGLIGAFRPSKAATFQLLHNCAIINLDDIKQDTNTVFLQVKDSGLIHAHNTHESEHTYIADKGGIPLPFNLNILERNAPYINHPDEV